MKTRPDSDSADLFACLRIFTPSVPRLYHGLKKTDSRPRCIIEVYPSSPRSVSFSLLDCTLAAYDRRCTSLPQPLVFTLLDPSYHVCAHDPLTTPPQYPTLIHITVSFARTRTFYCWYRTH